jgi:hypothetical protein
LFDEEFLPLGNEVKLFDEGFSSSRKWVKSFDEVCLAAWGTGGGIRGGLLAGGAGLVGGVASLHGFACGGRMRGFVLFDREGIVMRYSESFFTFVLQFIFLMLNERI